LIRQKANSCVTSVQQLTTYAAAVEESRKQDWRMLCLLFCLSARLTSCFSLWCF